MSGFTTDNYTKMKSMARHLPMLAALTFAASGCTVTSGRLDPTSELATERVRPGISVLLSDSMELIRGKRIGLLTNQTGVNERGRSDIDLLRSTRAKRANVNLTFVFSAEHVIRGTEDGENISKRVDQKLGLRIFSLYDALTTAPP